MVKDKISLILILGIFIAIGVGVYINVRQERAVDESKIPQKVELYRGFQRWITNLKNKGIEINADDFRLKEENEIYNTRWMKVYSLDDPAKKLEFETKITEAKDLKKVAISPSEREFIDYRSEIRDGYNANEVRFYGQKEDKLIDARIVDCSVRANCYFDRAYFINNDLFVVSEISRNIDKEDETAPLCDSAQSCTYTFKVHVIDLVRNSRLIYESKPFDVVLSNLIPKL